MKKLERWATLGNTYNKLIEADEAFRVLSDYYHHRTETQADALREALERVPEAVVRCKDCKWSDELGCAIRIVDESDRPEDDDYCSFGERRTAESE